MTGHTPPTTAVFANYGLAELAHGNRLLADYLTGTPLMRKVFPHPSVPLPAPSHTGADRARLAAALAKLQHEINAEEPALANARLLADPDTPVITVGQQPGLLTGPLYVPYKALTAISLARRLSARIGRPVVPVFWVGSDDDDRGEIDHCGWWDQRGQLQEIHYSEEAGIPGQLVGDLPAGPFGEQLIAQVRAFTEGQPFRMELLGLLRATLAESQDLGGWFNRLLTRLFSQMGLVICDPRQPEIRALSAAVLRREISRPLHSTALVNEQARMLRTHGYHPALTKPETTANFFLLEEGGRHRVTYTADQYHIAGRSYTPDELLAMLDSAPERLLPNAVLRPIVQEYLFGSSAFVAGPNELGYWAELAPVFQAFDLPMPPVIPRTGATLAPPPIVRRLREDDIAPLDVLYEYNLVRYRLLQRAQPAPVAQAFLQGRIDIERLVSTVMEVVTGVDSTLAQSALAAHQRMLNELGRLEQKTLRALERQSSEQTIRLEHLRETLFPRNGLQERTLNLLSVMARYGIDLPDRLLPLFDQQEGRHLFVEI